MIFKGQSLDIKNNKSYYVKSNDEYIADTLIQFFSSYNNRIGVVNALSQEITPILLPLYIKRNCKLLKRKGLNSKVKSTDLDFLKYLIDYECSKFDIVLFGLVGMHHEGVQFLRDYSRIFVKRNHKSFILLDYNPNHNKLLTWESNEYE